MRAGAPGKSGRALQVRAGRNVRAGAPGESGRGLQVRAGRNVRAGAPGESGRWLQVTAGAQSESEWARAPSERMLIETIVPYKCI